MIPSCVYLYPISDVTPARTSDLANMRSPRTIKHLVFLLGWSTVRFLVTRYFAHCGAPPPQRLFIRQGYERHGMWYVWVFALSRSRSRSFLPVIIIDERKGRIIESLPHVKISHRPTTVPIAEAANLPPRYRH